MKQATISDAPKVLNTNDRAMWVLGYNAAAEAMGAAALTDEQITAGVRAVLVAEQDEGCSKEAALAAFREAARGVTEAGDQPLQKKALEGKGELDLLYRFHSLAAEATAQALHLTASREQFLLREYVSLQVYAECAALEEVAEAIERRKADQSEQTNRLRLVVSGRPPPEAPRKRFCLRCAGMGTIPVHGTEMVEACPACLGAGSLGL